MNRLITELPEVIDVIGCGKSDEHLSL